MKRLAGLTIKEYTPEALSAEARGHLERIEARTIDFCSEQGEHGSGIAGQGGGGTADGKILYRELKHDR